MGTTGAAACRGDLGAREVCYTTLLLLLLYYYYTTILYYYTTPQAQLRVEEVEAHARREREAHRRALAALQVDYYTTMY